MSFFLGFGDELVKIAKSMRLGGGGRFAKLTQSLGAQQGVGRQATAPVEKKVFKKRPTQWWKKKAAVQDPAALAAAIGRKKYGKKRFQEMAAAGRKK